MSDACVDPLDDAITVLSRIRIDNPSARADTEDACDSRHPPGECPWCDQQGFDEHVAAKLAHNAETCADPACPDHGDDPHTLYTGDGSDL